MYAHMMGIAFPSCPAADHALLLSHADSRAATPARGSRVPRKFEARDPRPVVLRDRPRRGVLLLLGLEVGRVCAGTFVSPPVLLLRYLRVRRHVEVLPVRREDRVLAIPLRRAAGSTGCDTGSSSAGALRSLPRMRVISWYSLSRSGPGGMLGVLLVQRVVLRDGRAAVVALVDVRTVEELHEVVAVRIVGDPGRLAARELALASRASAVPGTRPSAASMRTPMAS